MNLTSIISRVQILALLVLNLNSKLRYLVHWTSGSGADKEILALAVDKFHYNQSVYQQELRYLER